MFKNYLLTTLRNLRKNKVYSFINIAGLAAGMAVAMVISFWIWDELSFDKYHKNHDRIAQVMQNQTFNGEVNTGMGNPIPLAEALRRNYGSDFKYVVASSWSMNSLIASGDKKINLQGNFMQSDAPDMLTLNMVFGTRQSFKTPGSVLISQSTSKALFGDTDPVGKLVKINVDLVEKVAGVYDDLPQNTSLKDVAFIAPFNDLTSWVQGQENNWNNNSFQVFVQLADNASMQSVSAKIKNLMLSNGGKDVAKRNANIFLQPMNKWHLYASFKNGVNAGGAIEYVWLFGIIGIFVLLLACINFMNLSTARSEKRAKEVGIRKAIGSLRSQLIGRFFSESLITAGLAFILSLVLVLLILPFFNSVSGKQMSMPWGNIYFWLLSVGFSMVTGIIAGIYPAFYLSSFNPVKVLKGTFKAGRYAAVPRKVLVITQFTVSVILIISTIMVMRQVQYAKSRPIGYSREGLITIIMQTLNYHNNLQVMRNELQSTGAITDMSESDSPITENDHYDGGIEWPGKDPANSVSFNTMGVTTEYGKTAGWQFINGRDFSTQFLTDSQAVVVNEKAMQQIGFKNLDNTFIKRWGKNLKVIGVVQNMITESPYEPVKPAIYYLSTEIGGILNIKLSPNVPTATALAKLAAVCKKYSPEEPFDYHFADEEYGRKFANEERVGKLAAFFASLAVLISCLGLFGMASFMAEQRVKEIGVRKVLGASVLNLWGMLSKDFVMLVVISFVIATPIAYYFMYNWLQHYAYRTSMAWWVFAATGAGAIAITLLTVSFQSIKAALANPVKSLRSE